MARVAAVVVLACGALQGCATTHVSGTYVSRVTIAGNQLVVEKCAISWSDETDEVTSSRCTVESHTLPTVSP
jgi:hypothetical protein